MVWNPSSTTNNLLRMKNSSIPSNQKGPKNLNTSCRVKTIMKLKCTLIFWLILLKNHSSPRHRIFGRATSTTVNNTGPSHRLPYWLLQMHPDHEMIHVLSYSQTRKSRSSAAAENLLSDSCFSAEPRLAHWSLLLTVIG